MKLKVRGLFLKQAAGLAVALLLAPCTFGNIYYVSTSGNDAPGNGSVSSPWKTLKYAVTRVASAQGHIIRVSAGTFIEVGPIEIPPGVSIEGAGVNQTIFRAANSFYYSPTNPGYAPEKFLMSLSAFNQTAGNQSLKYFTIDGDSKKLHGGIYVRYRNGIVIENVAVQFTNFSGIWLWDVKDSRIDNVYLLNCSWGSTGYSSGALNLGNVERVEIDQLDVTEDTGYGIKAIGPVGYNDIFQLKIHDSHISVDPRGLWNNGTAPNIAIELWQADLVGCEIYNSYVDNTISLVNSNQIPSTGTQTIRVHHNMIDLETRANGAGYGIELTVHDAEIDHNYFLKGTHGIANWDNAVQNWSIHHNVFYALQGTYPGEVVRSQWSGLHRVKLYNNTIEFVGNKTVNVIGVYGGASSDVELRNNLVVNSTTGYTHYPNELIRAENGATISNFKILTNSFERLEPGGLLRSLLQVVGGVLVPTADINLTNPSNPSVTKSGIRPSPYYLPAAGSSLIDAGSNVGYAYLGALPDIGALEYGSTPPANSPPRVSLTSPTDNTNVTAGSALTLTANASDNDGTITRVEFFNGATKLGEDLTNPYSFTWMTVPPGGYTFTAKAIDNQNGVTTSSVARVTVTALNQPPTISITSPSNNSTFTEGSSISINANATDADGTISKVEFFNGATKLGEDPTFPYSLELTNATVGDYLLTAKATDHQNGSTVSSPVAISVKKNLTPTVSIVDPVDNASFMSGSPITIVAHASDPNGTIALTEFFIDGEKFGEDHESPYSLEWSLPAGSFSLTVKATDDQGSVATSAPVTIEVIDFDVQLNPIVIFPNPSPGRFTLRYMSETTGLIEIKIMDLKSKFMLRRIEAVLDGENNFEFDANPITEGVYTVLIRTEGGETLSSRLLIQK